MTNITQFPRKPLFEGGISVTEAARRIRAHGGFCTDGRIESRGFSGWVKVGGSGAVAHYVQGSNAEGIFLSECRLKMRPTDRMPLFHPGNFPRCKVCQRLVNKRGAGTASA